jgi:hypothetical protein
MGAVFPQMDESGETFHLVRNTLPQKNYIPSMLAVNENLVSKECAKI